jgi:peroxiredoxin Q/BCP
MAQLRQAYAEYVARDVQVVVVGPDDPRAFAYYWQQLSLPFIGLPDPKASVLRLFGQKTSLFRLGREPAQVLIDKAGIACYVYYGHDISDIPGTDEILALVDELSAQADPAPTSVRSGDFSRSRVRSGGS